MSGLVLSLILWIVLGLAVTVGLWVSTIFSTGVLTVGVGSRYVTGKPATVKPWHPVALFVLGIILTLGTLVLVVYNVIMTIVAMVNYGG
jgi:hypothetical protein